MWSMQPSYQRADMFDDDVRATKYRVDDDPLSFDRVATAVSIDRSLAQDSSSSTEEDIDPEEYFDAAAAIGFNYGQKRKSFSSVPRVGISFPHKRIATHIQVGHGQERPYYNKVPSFIVKLPQEGTMRPTTPTMDAVAILSKKVFENEGDLGGHDVVDLDDGVEEAGGHDDDDVLLADVESPISKPISTLKQETHTNALKDEESHHSAAFHLSMMHQKTFRPHLYNRKIPQYPPRPIDIQDVQALIDQVQVTIKKNGFDQLRSPHFIEPETRPPGFVGAYGPLERKARVGLFLQKRRNRVWTKKVKYNVRKNFADSRMRVKGRFVKKEDEDLLKDLISIV